MNSTENHFATHWISGRPAAVVAAGSPSRTNGEFFRRIGVASVFAFASLLAPEGRSQPAAPASARAGHVPEYTIFRTAAPLAIDRKLDEAEWFAAPSVGEFVFPWWQSGKKERTSAKLLWDDEYLYLAFVCEDAHITARHVERDGRIPEDDCVEVMLTPDADRSHVYFNIEFNVIGGILDNFRPNGPDKPRAPKWDAEGVKVAGSFAGTLNDDSDVDRSWQVEVAIPWRNFSGHAKAIPPRAGTVMRLNLNRHGGKTNRQFSQWAPGGTPKPSFHTPDRFGQVVLSERTPLLEESR